MGCGGSKPGPPPGLPPPRPPPADVPAPEPAQKAPEKSLLAPEAAAAAPAEKSGNVKVYGVPPSMNCVGAIMLAKATGCGDMEKCMPGEDTNTPEFLKMNPFHQVPIVKDGDFCLGESSTVLRYLGEAYAKDAYPTDPKLRGFIDWAMDRFSSTNSSDAPATIYPLLGFAEPPADQAAAGKKCVDNLKEFCTAFLTKGKFIGGDKLSIADYKIAPFFFSYEHPAVQEKSLVVCPDRVKQFNKDFAAACGAPAGMLSSAGGFALKEMLDKKLGAVKEATPAATGYTAAAAATPAKTTGECVIYGVPPSMNCLGAIMMVTVGKCGRMEKCMPFEDTVKPDFLKINPFHCVPALKDGDYCLGESGAILRYVSSYMPDTYPEDPKVRGFINWAMDRFSGAMASDAVATVYPLLGFAEPPADQAAAGKKCTDNLKEFGDVFLKGKFVGGDKPSIADYRIAPFFFSYEHKAVQEKSLVVCPDRVKQFNKDFAAACGDAVGILTSAVGFALKEMLDKKLGDL